jgi:hypothetical protein
MVPTPGFEACDDMGAAFAGVFWGVLVTVWLGLGTFMAAGCGVVVVWEGGGSKMSVAGQKRLTERRWSPSSYCGLAQTSWQIADVAMVVAAC